MSHTEDESLRHCQVHHLLNMAQYLGAAYDK
jgi:hypothetical protein